jgi:hypothetical protein
MGHSGKRGDGNSAWVAWQSATGTATAATVPGRVDVEVEVFFFRVFVFVVVADPIHTPKVRPRR